jgi:hypothetical protein
MRIGCGDVLKLTNEHGKHWRPPDFFAELWNGELEIARRD